MIKKYAMAYKKGNMAMGALDPRRLIAVVTCSVGIGVALPKAADAEPQHGESTITCTNPYSGASWQIKIDYDRHTVDANPAKIDEARISWRDAANGWRYELDRKSGKLTVTVASATGGNFLHDNCRLGN